MTSNSAGATSASAERQTVCRDGQEFTEIREGLGRILVPVKAQKDGEKQQQQKSAQDQQQVFYNPVQQFNRDLTVLVLKAYGEELAARRNQVMQDRIKRKRSRADDGGERQDQSKRRQCTTDENSASNVANGKEDGSGMDTQPPPPGPLSGLDTGKADRAVASTGDFADKCTVGDDPKQDGTASSGGTAHAAGKTRKLDAPRFTILDALSATGLRAMRYAQELPFVTSVTANDLSPSAVEAIRRNAQHNGVESRVNVTQSDARALMYSLIAGELTRQNPPNPHRFRDSASTPSKRFDVVDLDPYGTGATFFDAAVHAVRDDGGLLCVTCTDGGVWASTGYAEKAFALYGGIPVKGFHCHEAGIRLILHGIATAAARHGLAIEPLLSLSIDYYTRIFVTIRKSPAAVKFLAGKTMVVYDCDQGCGAWKTQLLLRNKKMTSKKGSGSFYKHGLSAAPTTDRFCEQCGFKTHLAGPMYAGPIHSADFIRKILGDLSNAPPEVYGTLRRIDGVLQTALEEFMPCSSDEQPSTKEANLAAVDPWPFYFHPVTLAAAIHCSCPDEESFRGALRRLGYQVTRSHCKPGSLKTDAPWSIIWHIMREWVRQKAPVKIENIKENSAAYRLLRLGDVKDSKAQTEGGDTAASEVEVVFDRKLGQDQSKKGLVRYQANPTENWGPMSKASGH